MAQSPLYGQQAIRRDYLTDPRRKLMQALMQQGSSTAPVQSWGEGLARMLSGGVGALADMRLREKNEQRQADYASAMKQALMGAQGYEMPMPEGVQGPPQMATGMQGMSQAAMATGNPDIMAQAMEWQAKGMDQEREAQQWEDRFGMQQDARRSMYEQQQKDRERMAEMQIGASDRRAREAQQQRLDFFTAEQSAADRRAAESRQFELDKLTAKSDIAKQKDAEANAKAFGAFDVGMKNLESAMEQTETGPFAGRLPALTTEQQTAEGAMATMAPVLKSMFRTAGEGTFTDKDQELLMKMVPTRTDTPEARKAKISMIYDIVRSKLGVSMPSSTSSSAGTPPPPAGFK